MNTLQRDLGESQWGCDSGSPDMFIRGSTLTPAGQWDRVHYDPTRCMQKRHTDLQGGPEMSAAPGTDQARKISGQ